jgi:hypothetical protein
MSQLNVSLRLWFFHRVSVLSADLQAQTDQSQQKRCKAGKEAKIAEISIGERGPVLIVGKSNGPVWC